MTGHRTGYLLRYHAVTRKQTWKYFSHLHVFYSPTLKFVSNCHNVINSEVFFVLFFFFCFFSLKSHKHNSGFYRQGGIQTWLNDPLPSPPGFQITPSRDVAHELML